MFLRGASFLVQLRIGFQVLQPMPAQVDDMGRNDFLFGLAGIEPPLGGHRYLPDESLRVQRRHLGVRPRRWKSPARMLDTWLTASLSRLE